MKYELDKETTRAEIYRKINEIQNTLRVQIDINVSNHIRGYLYERLYILLGMFQLNISDQISSQIRSELDDKH